MCACSQRDPPAPPIARRPPPTPNRLRPALCVENKHPSSSSAAPPEKRPPCDRYHQKAYKTTHGTNGHPNSKLNSPNSCSPTRKHETQIHKFTHAHPYTHTNSSLFKTPPPSHRTEYTHRCFCHSVYACVCFSLRKCDLPCVCVCVWFILAIPFRGYCFCVIGSRV